MSSTHRLPWSTSLVTELCSSHTVVFLLFSIHSLTGSDIKKYCRVDSPTFPHLYSSDDTLLTIEMSGVFMYAARTLVITNNNTLRPRYGAEVYCLTTQFCVSDVVRFRWWINCSDVKLFHLLFHSAQIPLPQRTSHIRSARRPSRSNGIWHYLIRICAIVPTVFHGGVILMWRRQHVAEMKNLSICC